MSAKQTYAKTVSPLPQLPPELWLSVFREATFCPYLLDPDNDLDNFHFWGTRKGVHTALAKSMRIRRNLVLVCKTWHLMASEFLYEAVFVRHIRGLETLAHSTISTYGRYVRRIDVDINEDSKSFHRRDYNLNAIRDDSAMVSTFVHRLVQHTPNLQVAFLHMFCKISNQIIFACLADACQELRVVQSANQCSNLWNVMFSNCPNLRAVDFLGHLDNRDKLNIPHSLKSVVYDRSICPDFPTAGRPTIYPVQASLTSLSLLLVYLSTSTIAEFFQGSSFGNVNTLTLLSNHGKNVIEFPECLDELFPVIGETFPGLRTLSLHLPCWKVFDWSHWLGIPLLPASVTPISQQNMPSPQITSTQHDDYIFNHTIPRSVQELRLASKQYQAPSGTYVQFLEYLTDILLRLEDSENTADGRVGRRRSCRKVKFTDHRNVNDLMVHHKKVFDKFAPKFKERGVVVEDHLGIRRC